MGFHYNIFLCFLCTSHSIRKEMVQNYTTGIIYLLGSAVILYLDAFFPYDSLGPLQYIVPVYLNIDEEAIKFIDNNIINIGSGVPAVAHGNLLLLNGLHGPFGLKVYWPSAGVHSSIIYTFVMLAFLLKLDIPLGRKAVYFFIGTIGTGFVNVIRITSLSLFALIVTTNVKEWEAFHSVAGENHVSPMVRNLSSSRNLCRGYNCPYAVTPSHPWYWFQSRNSTEKHDKNGEG